MAYDEKYHSDKDPYSNYNGSAFSKEHAFNDGSLCKRCGSHGAGLTIHCSGSITYPRVDNAVASGTLDFIDGQWIDDPLLVLSMRILYKKEPNDVA